MSKEVEVAEDLREPKSLMEAIHILRSHDPMYTGITNPTAEQIEDLDAVIKGLRLQIDDGTSDEAGDQTAFELAVALLWHSEATSIREGVQLMEYLLKERWEAHWSTVTGRRDTPPGGLVESVADEDDAEGAGSEEEWVDMAATGGTCCGDGASAGWPAKSKAPATSTTDSPHFLRGTAIRGATAPPPPEAEDSSMPPSLTRDRQASSLPLLRTPSNSASTSGSRGTAQSSATATVPAAASSYTSPGSASAACTADASASCRDSVSEESSAVKRDAQLARCYYHLAVGHTKLRANSKAMFYVDSTLRLSPNNKDALLLKRLLAARLYVGRTMMRSVPLLALGLIFL